MYDICDFGAVGDGQTVCTQAIQKAIDACADSGGGSVTVSNGRYVTGTLILRSGVFLKLESSGILEASCDPRDYPDMTSGYWRHEHLPRQNAKCLIYAEKQTDTGIIGSGLIDGRGEEFCVPHPSESSRHLLQKDKASLPARMIFFSDCRNITLDGFRVDRVFAGWTVWLLTCEYAEITRLHISVDHNIPNSDGIHLTGCAHVNISACNLSTGDDCIVLRAFEGYTDTPLETKFVTVSDCILSSGQTAIRIGWQGCSQIHDCVFTNCVIHDSWTGIGCLIVDLSKCQGIGYFKEDFERRLEVRNIRFCNFTAANVAHAMFQFEVKSETNPGMVSDIEFANFTCTDCGKLIFKGTEKLVLKNIGISSSKFRYRKDAEDLVCENVDGLHMNNVIFSK